MTTSNKNPAMSFESFVQIVAEALVVDPGKIKRETHFINDLAVDSIRLVELYLQFEAMGLKIPQDAVWQIQTIGDAYDFYVKSFK